MAVEIAPGLQVRVARRAIAGVTPRDDEVEVGQEPAEAQPEPEPAGDDPPLGREPRLTCSLATVRERR